MGVSDLRAPQYDQHAMLNCDISYDEIQKSVSRLKN